MLKVCHTSYDSPKQLYCWLAIQHSCLWNRDKSCPLGYYRDLFYFYKIAQLDSLKSLHSDPIVNIHKDVHCIHEYMEPCIIQDSDAC